MGNVGRGYFLHELYSKIEMPFKSGTKTRKVKRLEEWWEELRKADFCTKRGQK